MLDRLSILMVGAGDAANSMHLPAWRNIKEADVVAVCDVNRESARKAAENWKIPRVYGDFDELLEKEQAGIVDLCTPPATHAPLAISAMEKGHHVVLEKPIAMTLEETRRIYEEYQRKSSELRLCVIQNFLFELPIMEIRSLVRRKRIDVLGVDIRMLHTSNDAMLSQRDHWVHSLPGGRFGECLIHPVYVLRNLIGPLKIRDIYTAKRGTYDWVDYDELYAALESGDKFGSIHVSFNSPRWTMPLSVKLYGKQSILTFDGTNSTFITQGRLLDGYLPEVQISRTRIATDCCRTALQIMKSTGKNAARVIGGRQKSGHENLFRSFVSSILQREEMPYTTEEACEAHKTFVEALDRLDKASASR